MKVSDRKLLKKTGRLIAAAVLIVSLVWSVTNTSEVSAGPSSPVLIMDIHGSINPATDEFLKSALRQCRAEKAKLLIIRLNTPGGLVASMQSMVQQELESETPVVVYIAPSGAGAVSAGAYIALAAHFAVMAPGTTIGAAHPVEGTGQDMQGDMRAKLENFAVSLMKAICEQRGRNVTWGEQAVRESISATDREAVSEKVVDFSASDLPSLLESLEGRTVTIRGNPVALAGLREAPLVELDMDFRQKVVNVLSDPNVAILLGLGAMLGLGLELYHPGAMLPGIIGVVCLVLSLTAAQVLPINYGGIGLLALSAVFFVVELFMPTFGMWGIAGLVCLVLGAIYVVDADQVWGATGYRIDRLLIGSIASLVGGVLATVSYLAVRSRQGKVTAGAEGLIGEDAVVKAGFAGDGPAGREGRVIVCGEYWKARLGEASRRPEIGEKVRIVRVEPGMVAIVVAGDAEVARG